MSAVGFTIPPTYTSLKAKRKILYIIPFISFLYTRLVKTTPLIYINKCIMPIPNNKIKTGFCFNLFIAFIYLLYLFLYGH